MLQWNMSSVAVGEEMMINSLLANTFMSTQGRYVVLLLSATMVQSCNEAINIINHLISALKNNDPQMASYVVIIPTYYSQVVLTMTGI